MPEITGSESDLFRPGAHFIKQTTNDPKLAGLNPVLLAKGECNEKTWMPEITG